MDQLHMIDCGSKEVTLWCLHNKRSRLERALAARDRLRDFPAFAMHGSSTDYMNTSTVEQTYSPLSFLISVSTAHRYPNEH